MRTKRGFSLIELAVAIVIIVVLLSILLPGLSSARSASQLEQCAHNQKMLGGSWAAYLDDHDQQFPVLLSQPGWRWGGARFSVVHDTPRLDLNRPLSSYVAAPPSNDRTVVSVFECPADYGIDSELSGAGTGDRSVFRSFGTSYRANSFLLGGRTNDVENHQPIDRTMLLAAPASMVLLGDAGWYEQRYETGRQAYWHGSDGQNNLLFLDGSVRSRIVGSGAGPSAVVFESALRDEPVDAVGDDE